MGLLLDKFEKIGNIEMENYFLGILSPASTLNDIYEEITSDPEIWKLTLEDTYHLVKNFEEYGKNNRIDFERIFRIVI